MRGLNSASASRLSVAPTLRIISLSMASPKLSAQNAAMDPSGNSRPATTIIGILPGTSSKAAVYSSSSTTASAPRNKASAGCPCQ